MHSPFPMRFSFSCCIAGMAIIVLACCNSGKAADDESVQFFEKVIRPALIEHCQECHGVDTEASGGLLLDSRDGWAAGGDSGVAIVPGDPEASPLLLAISYDDPDLQMPPDGVLSADLIEAFRQWIADGAVDPRQIDSHQAFKKQTGLPVERAEEHWAYRPLSKTPEDNATLSVDHFLDRKLSETGLQAAGEVNEMALARRLYFDLTGLPPSGDDLRAFVEDQASDKVALLTERLLSSPRYGEHFARKWMDVARYAESITLRGFVLPQAWRYRDYLIEAYNADRPFDQMIMEQLAGDLMPSEDLDEQRNRLIATAFLALGNTNLEQQDKAQLEMDYIDEQLEVIGRAFLGQTIGCARCHDHKFDPIPTADYYALAGIFRSAAAMDHDNVSKWIEQPLPLEDTQREYFAKLESKRSELAKEIAKLKLAAKADSGENRRVVSVDELPGVVMDSADAKLVGKWTNSQFTKPFIGDGYLHDENQEQGSKTATFEPSDFPSQKFPPGEYQVRIAYTAGTNRANNASVRVFSADGEALVKVNQRKRPSEDGLWESLGTFRFEEDGQAYVLVSNESASGHVIVDAVQFLPVEGDANRGTLAKPDALAESNDKKAALAELKSLEAEKSALDRRINDERPKYLTVVERNSPKDIAIHVRGDVHNLAEVVPRGFLTAIPSSPIKIASESSGRLEFAQWVASPQNALTARVYANRVWTWLMGRGIVADLNNFGTTGSAPSHPELLDWLATELIESGWSTKHLVRLIVDSQAFRRTADVIDPAAAELDPDNQFFWRGQRRRLNAEALRDAMLSVSQELDLRQGGSLIRSGTKTDYDYDHESTRRSIYHPVFRNSLPELFEAFDFANTSVSVGKRARSTVATQALVLLNHPWVQQRAQQAAQKYAASVLEQGANWNEADLKGLVDEVYLDCLGRYPSQDESRVSLEYLQSSSETSSDIKLELWVHSLFASLDFRFLD